tara:strand:+ start:96575 stop:96703 length:129 start_codon:yes stop_codon:yes gene_type:complete
MESAIWVVIRIDDEKEELMRQNTADQENHEAAVAGSLDQFVP